MESINDNDLLRRKHANMLIKLLIDRLKITNNNHIKYRYKIYKTVLGAQKCME